MMRRQNPLPLKQMLIFPFLALLALATFISSWISHTNAQGAARLLAYEFSQEIGNRVESHIHRITDILPVLAETNARDYGNGALPRDDHRALANHLAGQISLFPQLTFISFGLADGRYIAAGRAPEKDAPIQLITNFLCCPKTLVGHERTPDGGFGARVGTPFTYDPRQRPFMQDAIRAGTTTWSRIQPYAGYQNLGMGISTPIYDAHHKLMGVAGVSMALDGLNAFMQTLHFGEGGMGFLTEDDQTLIAASTPGALFSNATGEWDRLGLSQHPNPVIAAAAEAWSSRHSQTTLEINGQSYLAEFRPIKNDHGKSWILGILLPRKAFMSSMDKAHNQTLLICAITLCLVTLMGLWLSGKIAAPIARISRAAQEGAAGQLAHFPHPRTGILEVDQLSDSLHTLTGELKGAIDHLEKRVAQRTKELQAANEKLLELSIHDGLTGLANRRHFDQLLERECRRVQRSRGPLSLILCDIDHFKSFNDCHGHQVGDEVLQGVAQCLAEGIRRPMDVAARYGGEEFALILPNTDGFGALALARRLQTTIAAMPRAKGCNLGVTLSFGIATWPGAGEGDEAPPRPADLVARADARLYGAKAAGRNCIKWEIMEKRKVE
ncbi:MAG: diguanylate cyclase [Desulfobacterales bacterium]|nr:diguanylate cyclase [Desulfobacterales bacterium]